MQGHKIFLFVIDYIYNIPLNCLYKVVVSLNYTHTDEVYMQHGCGTQVRCLDGCVGDKCFQYLQCTPPPNHPPQPCLSWNHVSIGTSCKFRHIMHMHCMLYPQQTSLKYVYAHTLFSFFKELCMYAPRPPLWGWVQMRSARTPIFTKFGTGEED